ncbi:MAG: polyprenyl synthetase family protein [Microgenomates group bacterium]
MVDTDFISILKNYRDLVSPVVLRYLSESLQFPQYCQIDPAHQAELDFQEKLISEYPRRFGKYLRPSLVMATALAMGAKTEAVLLTAAAMQLSEEWILIHDDIEDDSEERRGSPTLQKLFNVPLAVNAGDALHVIMWKIIGDIDNKKVFNEFYQLLNRTTLGQTIDIHWNTQNKLDITDEDIFLILESKTCYYTISGPMRLGAIVAGSTDSQLNTIYLFGRYLGRAFQIIDDILDLTSDFAGLKKQSFNDIYEGKRTIPLSHLLKLANAEELSTIKSIYSKTRAQKSESEVATIINLMNKYHTIDSARDMAKNFAQAAKKMLNEKMSFIRIEPYRHQLETAIDFIVSRDH